LVSTRWPSGERYSRFRPDTTPEDTRSDAERKADRGDEITRLQAVGGLQRGGHQVVRDRDRLQHREVVFRARADHRRVGVHARLESEADALRAGDDVDVGEDHALVEDHHAAAYAALDFAAIRAVMEGSYPHDRAAHRVVSLGRMRRHGHGFERLGHRRIDILLRIDHRHEGALRQHENERKHAGHGCEQRQPVVAQPRAQPRRLLCNLAVRRRGFRSCLRT